MVHPAECRVSLQLALVSPGDSVSPPSTPKSNTYDALCLGCRVEEADMKKMSSGQGGELEVRGGFISDLSFSDVNLKTVVHLDQHCSVVLLL